MATIGGSCLCGGVRFEVDLPFRRANHCHCSFCRKHSGTFGLTQGRVPREQFRLLAGDQPELLPWHAALRKPERARVLAAERAVAVVRAAEGKLDLEAHAPAEAAAREWRHQ